MMGMDPGPGRQGIAPTGQRRRVVIVDDQRSMRLWLRHVLQSDGRLDVVGEAGNAQEARRVIKAVRPDVITLDIEMPGMGGLDFLERLMRLNPLPVVMVSSTTTRGSDAAVRALSLGAVDCLVKPTSPLDPRAQRDLVYRVHTAAGSTVLAPRPALPASPVVVPRVRSRAPQAVLIGASTGGVAALQTLLAGLASDGPPVVVVQHMPASFLISFSEMLNRTLPQQVSLARDGAALAPGQVVLAPAFGNQHTVLRRVGLQWQTAHASADPNALHCPSVNALFASAHPYAPDIIAVLLTGLGSDGANGMKALHAAGARTFAQDEASCVVYGMPRVAAALGAVEHELPLDRIAPAVNRIVASGGAGRPADR